MIVAKRKLSLSTEKCSVLNLKPGTEILIYFPVFNEVIVCVILKAPLASISD